MEAKLIQNKSNLSLAPTDDVYENKLALVIIASNVSKNTI